MYEEEEKTILELIRDTLMDPRDVIKRVCRRDPTLYFWHLVYFSGLITGLNGLLEKELQNFGLTIIKLLIFLPVIGVLWVYFGGWLLRLGGKLFNGQANPEEMRAVILWSSVPNMVVMLLAFFIKLAIKTGFGLSLEELKGSIFVIVLLITLALIKGIIGIWTLINQVRMISEVQKISKLATVLSMIIPLVALITPLLIPTMMKHFN